jgi:hypothetical protein
MALSVLVVDASLVVELSLDRIGEQLALIWTTAA